jgi:hypothetical protein
MSITIHQIRNLLNSYSRQQLQFRLTEAKARKSEFDSASPEDRVFISAEAKRLQIYQKTAEEVLKRLMEEYRDPEDINEEQGEEMGEAESRPSSTGRPKQR